jgi:hypothetical protein
LTKRKTASYLFIGILFSAISIIAIKNSFLFGWVSLAFFGIGSSFFLIKLFYSSFKWVNDPTPSSKEFIEKTKSDFTRIYDDYGPFSFTDKGFFIHSKNENRFIEWSQIHRLSGFKRDYFTTDSICLLIEYDPDLYMELSEEHTGWCQFLKHVKEAFPSIEKNWDIEIATPAFETNWTVLYERDKSI